MNLPFIVDVAIGLTFTFLILSLLASEIQELIATLLQWRAKHLKKTIEDLLAGGSEGLQQSQDSGPEQLYEEIQRVIKLVNLLYGHPLINTLNYESKGLRVTAEQLKSKINSNTSNPHSYAPVDEQEIFGKRRSAPSYIPSETFATSLLKTLGFRSLSHKTLEIYFHLNLFNQIESKIESLPNKKDREKLYSIFQVFLRKFNEIAKDFRKGGKNLNDSIESIESELQSFIDNAKNSVMGNNIPDQLEQLKQDFFVSDEKSKLAAQARLKEDLTPNLMTTIQIYKEIRNIKKDSPTYTRIKEACQDTVTNFDELHNVLPKSVIESLSVLARRAQIKAKDIEEQMLQFQQEIETWYDRAMDRTMGVYKRNTKGMLLIIGFILSAAVNADSINIASRLSEDTTLRNIITQNLSQINNSCPNQDTNKDIIACVNQPARNALKDASLPLGWTKSNLKQQLSWKKANSIQKLGRLLQMLLGLCLTTLAISMGAPFWFDLLSKFVNVRNTGAKPESYTGDRPTANSTKQENGS